MTKDNGEGEINRPVGNAVRAAQLAPSPELLRVLVRALFTGAHPRARPPSFMRLLSRTFSGARHRAPRRRSSACASLGSPRGHTTTPVLRRCSSSCAWALLEHSVPAHNIVAPRAHHARCQRTPRRHITSFLAGAQLRASLRRSFFACSFFACSFFAMLNWIVSNSQMTAQLRASFSVGSSSRSIAGAPLRFLCHKALSLCFSGFVFFFVETLISFSQIIQPSFSIIQSKYCNFLIVTILSKETIERYCQTCCFGLSSCCCLMYVHSPLL